MDFLKFVYQVKRENDKLPGMLSVNGERELLKETGQSVRGRFELFKTFIAKSSNMGKGKAFQSPLPQGEQGRQTGQGGDEGVLTVLY